MRRPAARTFFAAFLLFSNVGFLPASYSNPPNIIIILVDTLRADYLGCYGFKGNISPNIDKFASESVLFERCISPSSWTKPSISSMFTSLYPQVHGVHSDPWPPKYEDPTEVLSQDATTLAEVLADAGYQTASFVTNRWMMSRYGMLQGFGEDKWFKDKHPVMDEAANWLAKRKKGVPFFLYVHTLDTHGPYLFDQKDFDELKLSPSLGKDRPLTEAELKRKPGYLKANWRDPKMQTQLINWKSAYAAGIKRFDRRFGAFMNKLANRGLLSNTIVIVTSDHGEQFLEHGQWHHGNSLYIEETRVPLIIRLPEAGDVGLRTSQWVSLIDVMPTLLKFARVKERGLKMQGDSLAPLFKSGGKLSRKLVFSGTTKTNASLNTCFEGDYHAIWKQALFNLKIDPVERVDVKKENAFLMKEFSRKIEKHLKQLEKTKKLPRATDQMSKEEAENLRSLGYLQ